MPNWCNNDIAISGRKILIDQIKSKIISAETGERDDDQLLFNVLIGRNEREHSKDWYAHNVSRYGVKWDVNVSEIMCDYSPTEVRLSFATAWSPPVEFCKTLSNFYGDLEVHMFYDEAGNDFAGECFFRRGSLIHRREYSYNEGLYKLRKESWWDIISYDIESAISDEESFEDFINRHKYVSEEDKSNLMDTFEESSNA